MRRALLALVAFALAACTDGADPAAFCSRFDDVVALDAESLAIDTADADAVIAELAGALDRYEALADAAPSEIGDDVDELAAYASRLVQAVTAVETDDPFERAAAVADAIGDEQRLDEAGRNVAVYAEENCAL